MSVTSLSATAPSGVAITNEHFGVNLIAQFELLSAGSTQNFDLGEVLADFGVTTVRWPGGSDIENYGLSLTGDLVLRNGFSGGQHPLSMAKLDEFFVELAKSPGSKAIIEIPTFWLIEPDSGKTTAYGKDGATTLAAAASQAARVEAFVDQVLTMAADRGVTIAGFEIGNEYRGYLRAEGYAGVVAALAPEIAEGIASANTGQDPAIIIQIDDASNNRVPLGADSETLESRNTQVMSFLDTLQDQTARNAIDAAAFHFYYDEGEHPGTATTWEERYDTIDDWVAAFAQIGEDWGDLAILATEWGVVKNLPTPASGNAHTMSATEIDESNFGLMALAPTLEIFTQMVLNGVVGMTIWPLLNHPSALYADYTGAPLSPLGVLFDIMDENLEGKRAMDIGVPVNSGFDVHAFVGGTAGQYSGGTAFVSSLQEGEQTVEFNLGDLWAIPGTVTVQVIRATAADGSFSFGGRTWNGFSEWSDPDAHGLLASLPHSVTDGILSLTLGSHEVAVLHYDTFDRVITQAGEIWREYATDDLVIVSGGNNFISTGDGRDSVQGAAPSEEIRGGNGDDTLRGGGGNDTIYGGTDAEHGGADLLFGDENEDSLFGGIGADTLYGGSSSDSIEGGDGDDVIFGDSSADIIRGGNGNDVIDAGSSLDTVFGGAGADSILGGTNVDQISGEDGNDTIRGGTSNDTVYGGSHNDLIYGDDGDDSLVGDGSSDTIYGGEGDDQVDGGGSADKLYGGSDNDALFGGTNNDTLYGGASSDTLTGGTGADVFVFSTAIGSSIDTITDFSVADDTIWLEAEDFAGLAPGALAASAFVSNTSGIATSAAHRLIYESDTGALWFDADGNGATARVQFATLGTGLALTAADFLVI